MKIFFQTFFHVEVDPFLKEFGCQDLDIKMYRVWLIDGAGAGF